MNAEAASDTLGLVTVTAPGADELPCSPATCGSKGPHPQRAKDGCRVAEHHAVLWNRSAQRRWSELHRRAVQHVRRDGHGSPLVAYVWQLQGRGVFHLHVLVTYGTLAEQAATWAYVGYLKQHRQEWGFGFVDFRDRAGKAGKATVMESAKAAGYVSRYLGESSQFVGAIAAAHRPRRLVYVARRLTASTGCTMVNLRRVRFLWWIRRGQSSIVEQAGRLPRWFGTPAYVQVAALASAPP